MDRDDLPDETAARQELRWSRPALAINLGGSIAGGVFTFWLAWNMESWPIEQGSRLVYALIAPLLVVPPLWSVAGLAFAARTLFGRNPPNAGWPAYAAFAVALALALGSLPVFASALGRLMNL